MKKLDQRKLPGPEQNVAGQRARLASCSWLVALLASVGCAGPTGSDSATTQLALDAPSLNVKIDFDSQQQRISGFGTSSAWTTPRLSPEEADFFFSEERGIGLSLLRVRIAPNGTTGETQTALSAQARGARIWAAPWSPPGAWKTNGTDNEGGSLKPEFYQAWAERLANFAALQAEAGVSLLALSAQNEPNWTAEWETCIWTPQELATFIGDYLGPALRKTSPDTFVLGPESADWGGLIGYTDAILSNPRAREFVGAIATHSYGGTPFDYPSIAEAGKDFWQTEISYDSTTGIPATLGTARMIHDHLTIAQVNAWHYWWIDSNSETSLRKDGEILPQTYGLAHFSKFVRPGFHRVSVAPTSPSAGVNITAFSDARSGRFAIVAINESGAPAALRWDLRGMAPTSVTPWLTKEGSFLQPQTPIENLAPLDYTLPARSIVTLVGSGPGSVPIGGQGGAGGESMVGGQENGGAPELGGSSSEAGVPSSGGKTSASSGGKTTVSSGGKTTVSSGGTTSTSGGSQGGTTAPAQGGSLLGGAHGGGAVLEYPVLPGCYCSAVRLSQTGGSDLPQATGWLGVLAAVGMRRRRRSRAQHAS